MAPENLERVSPLRGLNGRSMIRVQREFENQMARAGQCILSAPEPTGLPSMAKVIKQKFPVGSKETVEDTRARVDKMWNYLRGRMNYAVILHEMGHTVGFRHNFTSSYDKANYRPQYWQLRTHNGTVTDPCTGSMKDGSDCVGPRYWDPLTQEEIDNSIWTWMHTT